MFRRSALLFLLAVPLVAGAQDVRPADTGLGSRSRQGTSTAEELGKSQWPDLIEGETGTQVFVTFDYRNADLLLITNKDVSLDVLVPEAQRIVKALGLPEADFWTRTGRSLTSVDVEFNDYLQEKDKVASFQLNLGALARELRKSTVLPAPIEVQVVNEPGATLIIGEREVDEVAYFSLAEVPEEVARFEMRLGPLAYVGAAAMIGLVGFLLFLPLSMAIRFARAPLTPDPQALTPEQVQENYDKVGGIRPWTFLPLLLPVVFFALLQLGPTEVALRQGIALLNIKLPSSRQILMAMPVLFTLTVIPMAAAIYLRRRRIKEAEGEAPKLDGLKPIFPLMIGLMVTPTMIFVPGIASLDRPVRLAVFLAPGAICLLISIFLGMKQSKVNKSVLKPGDLWHDETMQIAFKAGAKVKHVVVLLDEEIVNAFASPFGTVGLTKGLLDKLDSEEIRAVIAHEIGHHRHKHPLRNLVLTVALFGAILTLQFFAVPMLRPALSSDLYELLSGPVVFMPIVFLGPLILLNPGRRKAELEADRFAVEYMGDAEVVISALTKMHNINLMPHRLRTSDELLSTHPSLVNRIKSIKEIAANR